jgi:hypothetical protein
LRRACVNISAAPVTVIFGGSRLKNDDLRPFSHIIILRLI